MASTVTRFLRLIAKIVMRLSIEYHWHGILNQPNAAPQYELLSITPALILDKALGREDASKIFHDPSWPISSLYSSDQCHALIRPHAPNEIPDNNSIVSFTGMLIFIKKTTMDYLQRATVIFNQVTASGYPVSEKQCITHIMTGLNSSFKLYKNDLYLGRISWFYPASLLPFVRNKLHHIYTKLGKNKE